MYNDKVNNPITFMATPQEAPAETMPEGAVADTAVDSPAPDAAQAPAGDGKITIPLDQPEMADMFKDCEPGETLTVESKDDKTIVLTKEGYGGGEQDKAGAPADPDAGGEADENPAVAAVIAGKMKR